MPDRTYTEDEVTAILERTAELQAARHPDRRLGLTLSELEAVAAETGLDPTLLRRAAAELDAPDRGLFASSTGTSATHVYVERWVPTPLTPELWEDMVAELRHRYDSDLGALMGMPHVGTSLTEQIGRTVEWRHTSASGIETRVMIRPHGDGQRIRLSQRVGWGSSLAESVVYGGGLGALIGMIAGAVAESGDMALLVIALVTAVCIPLILYADQAWRRKKHRELHALADHLTVLARASATSLETSLETDREVAPSLPGERREGTVTLPDEPREETDAARTAARVRTSS